MSVKKTGLGDRMKGYENINRNHLISRMPVILRLDGKAFHTFCRGFAKPFDMVMARSMQATMQYLCENIQGCVLGYTQSDEITLVLVDYQTFDTTSWFDNNIQKMVSVAASMATWKFMETMNSLKFLSNERNSDVYDKALSKGAFFDCRAFNVPKEEVTNCVFWRQQDAIRNSKQALGQAHFSQRELHGKSTEEVIEMVKAKTGIPWEGLALELQRGSCCVRQSDGKWHIDRYIPEFKGEGREYIEKLINVGE
jgi:tRNA(His) 5'-end guanylyltransferase